VDHNPISRENVIQTCKEILLSHKNSRFRFIKFNYWQCWGCQKFGNKDGQFTNICALNAESNRGCRQVNRRVDAGIT
jgi:hypothetical protein